MLVNNTTKLFVSEVEELSQRRFKFRSGIEYLVEIANRKDVAPIFNELIFIAKFVSGAHNVLKSNGIDNTNIEKLANEYKLGVQKASLLLNEIVSFLPYNIKEYFTKLTQLDSYDNIEEFLLFMDELKWVKNYLIDKNSFKE